MASSIILILIIVLSPAWSKPLYKTTAGPLSLNETERNKLLVPPTWLGALTSSSTVYRVFLKPDAWEPSLLVWQTAIFVDSSDLFIFSIISPLEKSLGFTLVNPNGQIINTRGSRIEGTVPFGHTHFISSSYMLRSPMIGMYRILFNVSSEIANKLPQASVPNAVLICYNKSPYRLHSYLKSYNLHVGAKFGIIARIYNSKKEKEKENIPRPISSQMDIVSYATITVYYPSGIKKIYSLSDHEDNKLDKVFSGGFKLTESGDHIVQVVLRGVTPEGNEYSRSTQHVVPVLQKTVKVIPSARCSLEMNKLKVEVEVNNDNSQLHRLFAEVWTYENGDIKPLFWVSTIVTIQKTKKNSFYYVQFFLDTKWISKSDILILRNTYLQDLESSIITDPCPQIILHETKDMFVNSSVTGITKITEINSFVYNKTEDSTIVLLSDQYAERNPFKINADKFPTKSKFHRSSKVCHSIHSYAESVATNLQKLSNFSIIGHAFGGLAAIHMNNYFFTGLDNNDKSIQTIATAFKGSPAAGTIAMIGQVYQIPCQFSSISTDVANLWLTGINEKTRARVKTYASHISKTTLSDSCCLSLNLVLDIPNDGVVETSRSQLPGSNSTTIIEGFCHTWNMKQPALFTDESFISKLL